MTGVFELIPELSDGLVQFYTIKLGNSELSEFYLFDEKNFPEHEKEVALLYSIIGKMKARGAKHYYFKHEGPAHAIPRVKQHIIDANSEDYGIRLYCIYLTDYLVVLLNGDIKTTQNPIDCANVGRHFKNAVRIAEKLDRKCLDGDIDFTQPDCLTDFEIEI
ncbi:MAG: hypothetical protein QM763_04200 [Agriterribacter sp.]